MIEWVSTKERMPKEGNVIVLFDKSKHVLLRGVASDCLYNNQWRMELSFFKYGDHRVSYIEIDIFDYWAYASEFSFPKE